jgi:hypothetical protein
LLVDDDGWGVRAEEFTLALEDVAGLAEVPVGDGLAPEVVVLGEDLRLLFADSTDGQLVPFLLEPGDVGTDDLVGPGGVNGFPGLVEFEGAIFAVFGWVDNSSVLEGFGDLAEGVPV